MKKNKYLGMCLTLAQTLLVKSALISHQRKKDGEVVINYVNFEGEPKQIFKRPDHVENYQRGKEKKGATMVKFGEMHGFNH